MNLIQIKLDEGVKPPEYAHPTDSGMDLQANIIEPLLLYPGCCEVVPTGISVALPDTHNRFYVMELQVRPRSGLAANHGVTVGNSPGTIDSGYRGEIKVILQNNSNEVFKIEPGQKIAQAVLAVSYRAEWKIVEELCESDRGTSGFGSTGK